MDKNSAKVLEKATDNNSPAVAEKATDNKSSAVAEKPIDKKLPVVLENESDWDLWIYLVRAQASKFEIWEYVDPFASSRPQLPVRPVKPVKPSQPQSNAMAGHSKTQDRNTKSPGDLFDRLKRDGKRDGKQDGQHDGKKPNVSKSKPQGDRDETSPLYRYNLELQAYEDNLEAYREEKEEYWRFMEAIGDLRNYVLSTISRENLLYLHDKRDRTLNVYHMLVFLREELGVKILPSGKKRPSKREPPEFQRDRSAKGL